MINDQELNNEFLRLFHHNPDQIFAAPGRVNLIGEHTDYNDGFVLPAAIDFNTRIAGRKRSDQKICIYAADFNNQFSQFLLTEEIQPDPQAPWSNYIRGVVIELLALGLELTGADLLVSGNIPRGAGLSSSASLEIVTIAALMGLSNQTIDPKVAAKVGQAAENKFVGCNCGIMDQIISAIGQQDHATLIDCRSLDTRSVSLPKGSCMLIVDSGIKRGLVDSEYNQRRKQCEQVARFFEVAALRDITIEQLENSEPNLDEVIYRRARHVVTENARTLEAADALQRGDMAKIGELMAASHQSMKLDFEITLPAIDTLVDIIGESIGSQGGVRMTGGGFGGCVVALIPEALEQQVRSAIDNLYQIKTGYIATAYTCHASRGALV